MKIVHVVGGVAMALGLAEPGLAIDRPAGPERPCPLLRPMAKCAPEGRPHEPAEPAVVTARRRT